MKVVKSGMSYNLDARNNSSSKAADWCHKWLVFISGIMSLCITGLILSTGVFLLDVMEKFEVTRAQAVTVQSASLAIFHLSGVLSGALVSRLGPRITGTLGSLLVSFGMCMSFIAPSVTFLYFSMSFCAGLGCSMLYISASTAQSNNFYGDHSAIPLSIFLTGPNIGTMIWTHSLVQLVKQFGLRGSLILTGGLVLHGVPASILWKPPPAQNCSGNNRKTRRTVDELDKKVKLIAVTSVNENDNIFKISSMVDISSEKDKQSQIDCKNETSANAGQKGETDNAILDVMVANSDCHVRAFEYDNNLNHKVQSKTAIERSAVLRRIKIILKNKVFMAFNIANMISVQCVMAYLYTAFDLFADRGFNEYFASIALVAYSCAGIAARVCSGLLLKIPSVTTLGVLMIGALLNLIGAILLIFAQSYPLMISTSVLIGISSGFVFASWLLTTLEIVGKDNVSIAMGLLMSTTGMATAVAGPITGYIRDKTGSYTICLTITAVSLLAVIVILGYAQWMHMRTRSSLKP